MRRGTRLTWSHQILNENGRNNKSVVTELIFLAQFSKWQLPKFCVETPSCCRIKSLEHHICTVNIWSVEIKHHSSGKEPNLERPQKELWTAPTSIWHRTLLRFDWFCLSSIYSSQLVWIRMITSRLSFFAPSPAISVSELLQRWIYECQNTLL